MKESKEVQYMGEFGRRKGKIMSFSYNLKEIIPERIDYVVKMCVSTVVS